MVWLGGISPLVAGIGGNRMSVLDRLNRTQPAQMGTGTTDTSPDPQSTTSRALVPAEPPLARRVRLTMRTLMGFVEHSGTARDKRRMWLLDPLIDELIEEITEMDQGFLQYVWSNIGDVFRWMATGERDGLPPQVLDFIDKIEGIPPQPEPEPLIEESELVPVRVKVIEGTVIGH